MNKGLWKVAVILLIAVMFSMLIAVDVLAGTQEPSAINWTAPMCAEEGVQCYVK